MAKRILTGLLFTLALLECSLAPAFADSYSISIPGGLLTLIANQLDNGGNTLSEILPNVPDETTISKWDCSTYAFTNTAIFFADLGGWIDNNTAEPSSLILMPGEGAILFNPGPSYNVTFSGTPHVPVLPPQACGCGFTNLLGRQTNGLGTFENITGVPPSEGSRVNRLVGGGDDAYLFSNGAWAPSVPSLQVGESAFFFTPCQTNQCIVMQCAGDQVVNCGTPWSFTPPAASDPCCASNITISVLGTVTNGSCPQVITRTWQATDFCSMSVTCSQSVTVEDISPPALTCAPNKTVQCGTNWTFDTPVVSGHCSSLAISVVSTTTNGFCPEVVTRVWKVTDCSSNVITCAQTITVQDTNAPVLICPVNVTVQCDADVPAPNLTMVKVTDNCDPAPVVVHDSDVALNTQPKAILRTYKATDQCGNIATCTQTITVDNTVLKFLQEAYLKPSNTRGVDELGRSMAFGAVAISGDTVVVGAYGEGSSASGVNGNQNDYSMPRSGAAYIFVRSGNTWSQQAYLKASNPEFNDSFGLWVAIDGDTVVVGAKGEDSGATGVNGNQSDNSAPDSGAAYIFVRSGTTWTQQAYLKASNTDWGDGFGYPVAISGDTVAIGALSEQSAATGVNGNQNDNSAGQAGAVYVFVRSGTTWSQQAYLKASNTEAQDTFGFSVSVWDDTVIVGAPYEDSKATGVNGNQTDNSALAAGAVYVFTRTGTSWSQQAYLKASNARTEHVFGQFSAISGDTIVVSAFGEDSNATGVGGNQNDQSAPYAGAAYIFVRNGGNWSQQAYLKASNTQAGDAFGHHVAVSGDTVVLGAIVESSNATGVDGDQNDNSESHSGAAYVFVRNGTSWSQRAYLKASNTETFDGFGFSVAVSSNTVAVAARIESSDATGVNGPQNNNNAYGSGAAYIFNGLALPPPVITCFSNKQVVCGMPWNFDPPTAVDGCGLNLSVTILNTLTNAIVHALGITRSWEARDVSGRTVTCSQTVTVIDTNPPAIVCPSDIVVCADVGQSSKSNVTYSATATDVCSPVSLSCTPPSGSMFAVGATPVSCVAVDAAGNSNQCAFVVQVFARISSSPMANLTRCRGDTATFTAVTSGGGAISYSWRVDNVPVGTDSPLVTVATSGLTNGNHTVQCVITGECGSITNLATLTVQLCAEGGPCSFTQGFYGNANGKFNGTRSITLISNLLATSQLVVGKTGVRSLIMPQSAVPLLQQRMPSGGTAAVLPLTGNHFITETGAVPLSSKNKFDNILLGQTITLSLNVRLAPSLLAFQLQPGFCTQGVSAGPDGSLGTTDDVPVAGDIKSFSIPASVLAALTNPGLGINNTTVFGLLELANRALANMPTGGASLPDINAAVDAINRGFDVCRVLVNCNNMALPISSPHFAFSIFSSDGSDNETEPGPNAASSSSTSAHILRLEGFNCDATKGPGEPDIAGNPGGKPLWWQWQATTSGLVTLQTAGSSFDTLLGVYVGPSRSNATLVASSDDTSQSVMAALTFPAIAGTNYMLVVDGFDGACGKVILEIVTRAPRLREIKVNPGGQLIIQLDGESGQHYLIEGSSDLLSWETISVARNGTGVLDVVHRQARTAQHQFYRVVVEP